MAESVRPSSVRALTYQMLDATEVSGLPGITRAVLNALAKAATQTGDGIGETYIKHDTVAERVGHSEASVRRAIRDLVAMGILTKRHRYVEGRQTSNLYLVDVGKVPRAGLVTVTTRVVTVEGAPGQADHDGVVTVTNDLDLHDLDLIPPKPPQGGDTSERRVEDQPEETPPPTPPATPAPRRRRRGEFPGAHPCPDVGDPNLDAWLTERGIPTTRHPMFGREVVRMIGHHVRAETRTTARGWVGCWTTWRLGAEDRGHLPRHEPGGEERVSKLAAAKAELARANAARFATPPAGTQLALVPGAPHEPRAGPAKGTTPTTTRPALASGDHEP